MDDFNSPRTVWSSRFLDGLAALIAELAEAELLRSRALGDERMGRGVAKRKWRVDGTVKSYTIDI